MCIDYEQFFVTNVIHQNGLLTLRESWFTKSASPKTFCPHNCFLVLPHEHNMLKWLSIEYRSNYFRKDVHLWVTANWSFMRSIPFWHQLSYCCVNWSPQYVLMFNACFLKLYLRFNWEEIMFEQIRSLKQSKRNQSFVREIYSFFFAKQNIR
jgi:hypothetical protein